MAAYDRLPSGKWRARYRIVPGGKQYSRTFRTKAAAQVWAAERESEISRGIIRDPRAGEMAFGEWFEKWLGTRMVEESTALRNDVHARLYVLPQWKGWPVQAITRHEVQAWVARLHAANVGPPTIRGAVSLLGAALSGAMDAGLAPTNAAHRIRLPAESPKQPRPLSLPEQERLLAEFEPPYHALILTALTTGMRWGECAGLTRNRLHLDRAQIVVQEVAERDGDSKPHPKGRRSRSLPLPEETVDALRSHLDALPALAQTYAPDRVFVTAQGHRLAYANFRSRVFAPAVERAGIPAPLPSFHDLRHTYATMLAAGGVPQHIIQYRLGHATARMSGRYMHATGDDDRIVLTALRNQRSGS